MKSWEPQEGESIPAFQAFAEYRDLGVDRSLEAVRQKVGKSSRLLARWSSRWKWVERVKEYEAYMDSLEQKAREKALTKKAEDWATKELEMAALLYDKAKAMLAFPLAQQRSKDGQTIVEPARWGMRDAASIAEVGVKMERLARGQSTENVTVDDKRKKLAEVLGVPIDHLPIDATEHIT